MARVCTHKRISCARRASLVSNLAGPCRRDSFMRDEARTIDETAGVLKRPSARIYTVHVGSIARPDDRTVARATGLAHIADDPDYIQRFEDVYLVRRRWPRSALTHARHLQGSAILTNRQHPVSKRSDDHGVHAQRRYH